MGTRVLRLMVFGFVASAAALAACTGQPPPFGGAPSAPQAHAVRPFAAPAPTGTVIALGDAIGIPTFPTGDTASGGQGLAVDGIGCDPVMDTAYHIHIHLDIFDAQGNQLQLPWGVGIVAPWGWDAQGNAILKGHCYYDLHTHDRDGVIHYETADRKNLTLGAFFDIWGMPLSTTDVANHAGTVWVMYGTKAPSQMWWSKKIDPRTIPLAEHEFIYLAIDNPPSKYTLPVYHWSY